MQIYKVNYPFWFQSLFFSLFVLTVSIFSVYTAWSGLILNSFVFFLIVFAAFLVYCLFRITRPVFFINNGSIFFNLLPIFRPFSITFRSIQSITCSTDYLTDQRYTDYYQGYLYKWMNRPVAILCFKVDGAFALRFSLGLLKIDNDSIRIPEFYLNRSPKEIAVEIIKRIQKI